MAHFCWFLRLGFLLLMLSGCRTRPTGRQSELIAGNEFLKLFLDHDEQQRSLHSSEQEFEGRAETHRQRTASGRSLEHRTRFRNTLANSKDHEARAERGEVVKLVTSGSKIVFLEDEPRSSKSKTSSDEVKVVAVSVSSSSKRGPSPRARPRPSTSSSSTTAATASGSGSDFVNRSHKSELSIEETEPRLAPDAMEGDSDSLNSASNIQSVLAAPALAGTFPRGSNRSEEVAVTHEAVEGEDKLLPFQTVIYHDSKQGRGPQSRSISYSSISQNVDDLQAWQQSTRGGILAEAQRNVSESLKPIPRPGHGHPSSSEPAKFYSVPSKMYSVPSKFYSEPSKVYSEPSKMYGQPEKVYSEPSKVYGQPSKFYSQPAKVYGEPAKVYGEPAKTYWPQTVTTSTVTPGPVPSSTLDYSSSPTKAPGTSTTPMPITVPPGAAPSTFVPSRSRPRPAIVSRIAFGEAQSTSTSTTTAATAPPALPATTSAPAIAKQPESSTSTPVRPTTWQHHYHSYNHQQQHHPQHHHPTASPPRRVLFNLDKLPYDLLNAPQPQHQQSPHHLLDPSPSHFQQPQPQPQPQPQQRPCWEQRQHSSLPHQHSNQNAKGLPNRDLVKCISKFAHQHGASSSSSGAPSSSSGASSGAAGYSYSSSSTSSSSSSSSSSSLGRPRDSINMPQHHHFTTERPEQYTPTSEQNYEIEESVSVMTNGRAHGPQGQGGGAAALATVTSAETATPPAATTTASSAAAGATTATSGRGRGIDRGRGSVVYNADANANHDYDAGQDDDGGEVGDESGEDADGNADRGREGAGAGAGAGNEEEDKVAYVVEGRNYRKYRVEEKTDDGFIVGEYGVVDHNDGNLWGVRYTADSTINRSLIQKALLAFLKLK
ncbi:GL13520 [Drosophila persimilis]|uniref:GL13520 n=1 Tax=Drosophila persimilis TaxID=7234 RepID=B4GNB1_DROPE|nr:mucin-5AC [Drosophila persimilis]EDW39237.1 GL13520 [Drosophila persimilis]